MNRWSITVWLCMVLCTMALITYEGEERRNTQKLQQGIAKEIIRFHVRANSDSEEDQALKLIIKDELVKYMGELLSDVHDKQEAKNVLEANIENIENVAKGVIIEQKKEYNVEAYFENSYFPVKMYADMTFPAGVYEAFRVDIGDAKGKNWWCVVYPKLCFVDVSYGVMSKEAQNELDMVLDEDEMGLLYENSPAKSCTDGEKGAKYVYEFKIFRFLNKLFN